MTVTISDGSQAWASRSGGRPAAADLDAPDAGADYSSIFLTLDGDGGWHEGPPEHGEGPRSGDPAT